MEEPEPRTLRGTGVNMLLMWEREGFESHIAIHDFLERFVVRWFPREI